MISDLFQTTECDIAHRQKITGRDNLFISIKTHPVFIFEGIDIDVLFCADAKYFFFLRFYNKN